MSQKRIFLFSLIISLCVWTWFSWPLPRYFCAGIPAAAHVEPAEVQPLIPGDHLQFMYYCWLAGDMVSGNTPLFCNLYEFNMGDEKSGYRPDSYYFPFSLVYALSAFAAGRAFGWNFTGFLSLWLTFFVTWLLVRRYTNETWLAACAALIALTLPFRWINLCGGSPAGFAILWIPAILLGIDLAVRDGRAVGGVLAGVSLLFASWTDSHVFFFGALAAPCWAVIALAAGLNGEKKWQDSWQKVFAALLPIPLFVGGALAFPALMQMIAGTDSASQYLAGTVGARSLREIALYSPTANGFFAWFSSGASGQIYIGFSVFIFLMAGIIFVLFDSFRRRDYGWRRLVVMVLLLAGIAGIMALALGTSGPFHALFLRICRKIIPPYAMIRQPTKIFCLMPTLLAVAAGISLSAVFAHIKIRQVKIITAMLFCAAITAEYVLRVNPTVSLLDLKQGAYAAVADQATVEGKAPQVLVIPLWPGDSHYSSVYQHYASLYRVRMVNGYNPFVSRTYFENVFRPYESVNQGWLTDKQIDELLRRKIEYIILHEDLFPEKVSPFPVGFTLKQFLTHKRLRFIKQEGRVWAFKMLVEQKEEVEKSEADNWKIFGCARNWQAENLPHGKTQVIREASPFHVSCVVLSKPGSWFAVRPQRVSPTPQLRFLMRARGAGAVIAEISAEGKIISRDLIDIQTEDWEWFDVPADNFDRFAPLGLKFEYESGSVECDQVVLSANEWVSPSINRTIDLPAPCMFHAGYTSLADNAVVLEKEREAKALVFYGPKLPLERGRYRVELVFGSDSPRGVLLGQFNIKRHARDHILNWVPVMAGARSLAEFTQSQNVPMYLEFRFLGNGNIKISGIKITRLE